MKTSQFHLVTQREVPSDAEIASHQLMLRTGMIRKLTSGIYSWTPLGLKALRRVEKVVREEMDAAGALEMLMPAVQPAELWQETDRWDQFGAQLLKITDRAGRAFAFGPTHEEVITEFARGELRSYKQLPICFYQVQTKFRDEIRPRFGVMRSREFLMKDGYSFHMDSASLDAFYQVMHATYSRIFERLGLKFKAVEADSGAIGGARSRMSSTCWPILAKTRSHTFPAVTMRPMSSWPRPFPAASVPHPCGSWKSSPHHRLGPSLNWSNNTTSQSNQRSRP